MEKTILKTTKWTETEKTPFGEYSYNVEKEFATYEGDEDRVTETTWKNGVMTFRASYPIDSDYARERMS